MVKGCEEEIEDDVKRPVVVVDLDGTLIHGNTLKIFFRAAVRDAMRRHAYGFVLRAMGIYAARKLRFISHRTMKFAVLKRIAITEELRRDFTHRVDAKRRESVAHVLDKYRDSGARIILATAAPDIYVPWIWGGEFVATPTYDNPDRQECRGTAKLAVLRSRVRDFDQRLTAVLTDHHDDLALLGAGARDIYLVAPTAQSLMTVSLANIHFHRLD